LRPGAPLTALPRPLAELGEERKGKKERENERRGDEGKRREGKNPQTK